MNEFRMHASRRLKDSVTSALRFTQEFIAGVEESQRKFPDVPFDNEALDFMVRYQKIISDMNAQLTPGVTEIILSPEIVDALQIDKVNQALMLWQMTHKYEADLADKGITEDKAWSTIHALNRKANAVVGYLTVLAQYVEITRKEGKNAGKGM